MVNYNAGPVHCWLLSSCSPRLSTGGAGRAWRARKTTTTTAVRAMRPATPSNAPSSTGACDDDDDGADSDAVATPTGSTDGVVVAGVAWTLMTEQAGVCQGWTSTEACKHQQGEGWGAWETQDKATHQHRRNNQPIVRTVKVWAAAVSGHWASVRAVPSLRHAERPAASTRS